VSENPSFEALPMEEFPGMNAILVNACMAVFWLFLGITLIAHELMTGNARFVLPIGINPGWVAILFATFNVFRCWYNWSVRKRIRQREAEDRAIRQDWERNRPRPEVPPNPEFKFTDER